MLNEEDVDVSKRTVGKEAVKVGKGTVTDKEHVEGKDRDEEILVEQDAWSRGTGNRGR